MKASSPPPSSLLAEDNVAAIAEAGPAWHETQGIARAIEEAMSVLGQERKDGFGLAGTDIDIDILSDDDGVGNDDGMTRDVMGPEYTENMTLSRVDFDQWMANHAELDESAAVAEYDEEEEYDEQMDYSPDMGQSASIHDRWQADCQAWGLQNRAQPEQAHSASGFGTKDDPIVIGSSDVDDYNDEEEDYGEYEEERYGKEHEGGIAYSGDEGNGVGEYQQPTLCPRPGLQVAGRNSHESHDANAGQYLDDMECGRIQHTDLNTSEYDQVASAMLFLNGGPDHATDDLDAFAKATEPMSPPLSAYQRPPLPPAHLTAPSLAEMHKAIDQSIDRSLTIVDEISMCCDTVASSLAGHGSEEEACNAVISLNGLTSGQDEEELVRVLELESQDSIELAGQAIERLREFQSEAASKQNELNTQIFRLSAELFQTTSDKATAESAIKQLERENGEYAQTIDDLQHKLEALRSASNGEIEGLKDRVRHVAGKIASVTGELAEAKDKLDETKQVLAIVDSERTDLIGKCRGLESSVESLVLRLDGEQQQHEQTKQALHMACDGNANEARRAELETANRGLEQRCKGLADELAQSKNRERLLLNTNRALEARLGDTLRKLDDPAKPEGLLADHRRNWDSQLVECRKETADARRRLEFAEANLADERRGTEALRRRVQELETMDGQRGDQSVKKRRLEESAGAADGEDGDFVVVSPMHGNGLRSYSYGAMTTPSRAPPPSYLADDSKRSAVRNTLAGGGVDRQLAEYRSEVQKTLVDAGEHARDRRRKNDLLLRTAEQTTARRTSNDAADRPVTPRIGLRTGITNAATTPLYQQKRGMQSTPKK